ncbi:hypothetical protein KP509_04G058000 [Ceratopteris richardii]|uniref:HAT C-terminal dimerisation domain-containing protein n=1 Tax=Ceratopteris richardii TaxID=49495 RepID=A0A8T2UX84_CERRI|nr:hypothetical protein KP509_04G058000 [Ceratopteris richardii]
MYLARALDMVQQTQFDIEFIMYSSSMGPAYSRPTASQRDFCKFPVNLWQTYGYNTPIVSKVALRECSSGACERNWSAYSLVHTKIRNRLSTMQLQRSVYCRANLKVARAFKEMTKPKQIDIDSFVWSDDIVRAPPSRDEEDDIYRMLHRDLESEGTRVNRSRSRVTTQRAASSTTRLAPRGPRPRRARVMRGSSSCGRGLPTESDTLLDIELDLEDEEPLMPPELVALEFDDEGRVLEGIDGDSSSSEDSDI